MKSRKKNSDMFLFLFLDCLDGIERSIRRPLSIVGLSWKVYSAVKKSTRQPASVFVLEKSQLDQYDK